MNNKLFMIIYSTKTDREQFCTVQDASNPRYSSQIVEESSLTEKIDDMTIRN